MDTTTTTKENFSNDDTKNETLLGSDGTSESDVFRFTHEGDKPQAAYTSDTIPKSLMETVADPVSHEIADFCRRPALMGNVEWKSGDVRGNSIISVNTSKFRTTQAWDKLKGFFGFTATFCFKVVTNNQPTQCGALLNVFVPDGQEYAPFSPSTTTPAANLTRLSCLPSVTHNIGSVSESEIRVAYRGIRPFLQTNSFGAKIADIKDDFGTFQVVALSPLAGPTNTEKVNVTVYMWLEDLMTYGTAPTYPIAVQNLVAEAVYQGHVSQDTRPMKTKIPRAQPAVKEAANKTGPISGFATKVANIADVLSTIPGVSDIAGPVSWAARGTAQIASMLGYSKPHDITPSVPMTINPFKDFPHASGVSANMTKLTINDDQEVAVRALGPTDDDEMNINYLIKRPCLYLPQLNALKWSTADTIGKIIYNEDVSPGTYQADFGPEGNPVKARYVVPTTLAYMNTYFRYWRGTINLTFAVVGTKFHSGRLRAQFVPNVESLNTAIDWTQGQHIYTHIIDIRDANTFTIQIPFTSLTPWLKNNETLGVFRLLVETPLIAHPSTTSTIELLPYVSATDFQFAGPYIDGRFRNCNGASVPQPDSTDAPGVHDNLTPEPPPPTREASLDGFTETTSNDAPAKTDITNSARVIDPTNAWTQCIGDPIVSLRTLSKRMTFNTNIKSKKGAAICIQANALSPVYFHPVNGNGGDFIDFICSMFLFRCGGMRFALYGPFDDKVRYKYCFDSDYLTNSALRSMTQGSASIIGLGDFRFRYSPGYTEVPYYDKLQGALQFECPYYSKYPFLRNGREYFLSLTPRSNDTLDSIIYEEINDTNTVVLTENSQDNTIFALYRAGADDFNAGFFIGPPILKFYTDAAL